MAVLLLCLLVFASILSSCGYFTEQFLSEYAYGIYSPDDFLENDETTRRQPTVITQNWPQNTERSPSTTRAPEATRAPETTRKPETTVPETTDNIPDEFQNHVFLDMKDSGRCDELVGNVLVTVILITDSEAAWSVDDTTAAKKTLYEQELLLETAAAKYGKKLDIVFSYIKVSYSGKIMSGDEPESWQNAVALSAGFSSLNKMQTELDNSNDYDSNPVAFLLNKPGRAYANWSTSTSRTERMTLFSSDLTSFSHEICHLFGAQDYYYPAEVKESAENLIPESIMNSGEQFDAFTAFCIGWDDEIDKNAYDFLASTAHLTNEYLNAENEKQSTTGNVTDFYLSNYKGTYTGYLDRGVPNGQGSMKYDNGNSYEGSYRNGSHHGKGVFRWNDGAVYDGDWVDGDKTGKGTMTYADGDSYSGDWVDNELHGKGTYTWASGSKYVGDWVNSERTGQGTYTWNDGSVYKGAFVNGVRTGYGVMTNPNGTRYEGYYVDGKYDGQGTYTASDYSYTGSFKGGKFHGYGKMTWSDGAYYEGDYLDGSRHGQGTYKYAAGHVYVGAWENGERSGYGEMSWNDGSSYAGYWQNSKRHGYGKYINKNGTVFEGQWYNDQFQS